MDAALQQRVDDLRERVDMLAVVGREVRLSRGSKPRGKCPFHGSKSDSFAVYAEDGKAYCFGCQWGGDAIAFVRDFYGLDFMGALVRLEQEHGLARGVSTSLDTNGKGTVRRERNPVQWRGPAVVESAVVARHLWAEAVDDPDSLKVWLLARRVPEAALLAARFGQLRFCASAPISPWPVGGGPGDVAHAPAMVGLIRRPVTREDGSRAFVPIGIHATYLSPGLRAKMNRKRGDGSSVPARKVYGESAGGCVLLGRYDRSCALYAGEGIETVLSGMAMAGAREDACGLAVLSLDNLQGKGGGALLAKVGRDSGVLPLWNVRPDPARAVVCFAHDGPVTGLIDADMAPLLGPLDRASGKPRGLPVQERPGGPMVRRAISSAERSAICANLFTLRWRAAGCRRVTAIRPRMGLDFNDLARERA